MKAMRTLTSYRMTRTGLTLLCVTRNEYDVEELPQDKWLTETMHSAWDRSDTLEQQQAESVLQCSFPKCQTTGGCVGACTRAIQSTPPQQQAEPGAWDKPSTSFNDWWDSYRHNPANPFAEGSAAYWAWAGWQAAQRPWVEKDIGVEQAPEDFATVA